MAKLKNWTPEQWKGDAVKRRPYADRRDYIENQRGAFQKRQKAIRRFDEDVDRFQKNFGEIPLLCGERLHILCLGARTGAEVMAMRNLDNLAYGFDLEPVANGYTMKYMYKGDFHDLQQFANKEFDVVYTNSYDHVYDLDKALKEVKRVLKPEGTFILECVAGYEEGGCPGDHEAMYWRTAEDFVVEVERRGFHRVHDLQKVPYVKGLPFQRAILKNNNNNENQEWNHSDVSSATMTENPSPTT